MWKYKLPLAKLDIRCWTGPDFDVPLPSPVRGCLQQFANATAADLQTQLGLLRLEHAASLKERAEASLQPALQLAGQCAAALPSCSYERAMWQPLPTGHELHEHAVCSKQTLIICRPLRCKLLLAALPQ